MRRSRTLLRFRFYAVGVFSAAFPVLTSGTRLASGLFLWLAAASTGLGAAPSIDSITATRVPNRGETKLILNGDDLNTATALWTSFGVSGLVAERNQKRAIFRFTNGFPVGVLAARVFGSNGVSELQPFLLDDLSEVMASETNRSRSSAGNVEVGTTVTGSCDVLGIDWFKLHLVNKQQVSLEIVASRLGSKLDSVLRVTDASGRQIARNDDAAGLSGDSFIRFEPTKGGDYFVELRDVNYGGGKGFFYRLRVGDYPLATTAFPLAAEEGTERTFELAGPAGGAGSVRTFVPNSGAVPLVSAGRIGSTFAKAFGAQKHEVVEREPNDDVTRATQIEVTDEINGRFDTANDRDCYQFTAHKGERIEFRAATRSLGSPCDVILELQSADRTQLARSNPSSADEGVVAQLYSSNGLYCLIVSEATGAFGPNCVYRITTRRAAGFGLTVDRDRVNVAGGQTFDLNVICDRGEYKGPVTLITEGIAGLTVTNNTVAAGKTNVTIRVTASASLKPAVPRLFRIVGTARRDDAEVRVQASTGPALRRIFPQLLYPPEELNGWIALGVMAAP